MLTIHDDIKFMQEALEIAKHGMNENIGGPFGAVLVDNETKEILSKECNQVIKNNDPTAHAEIMAIRKACEKINNFDLSEGGKREVTLYCTCYPCPMCLGGIYWSRIKRVIFSGDSLAAQKIGFDDSNILYQIKHGNKDLIIKQLLPEFNEELFTEYEKVKATKTHY